MQLLITTARRLNQIFRCSSILAGIFAILPFVLLAAWQHDNNWQKACVITISSIIVYRELKAGPLLVILHGGAMVIGFILLFLSIPYPWLFVGLCALLGAALICLTGWDRVLRTFGTWTFIPVVYSALENNDDLYSSRLHAVAVFTPYLLAGLLPVLIWSLCHRSYSWINRQEDITLQRHLARWHHLGRSLGNGIEDIVTPSIATALAVGVCAWLVERSAIPEGQWFIWSAASVITGELSSTHQKIKDRAVGAMVGVPVGILLGLFIVPHSSTWVDVAGLLTLLTIVGFRNYLPAFASRCAGHSLIITLLGGEGLLMESSRLLNVVGGGLIGIAIFYALHLALKHRRQSRHQHSAS